MTEKIYCKNCDMLLYFGEEVKRRLYMRAIPSEDTVLEYYDNKCPRCGNKLDAGSINIELEGRKKYVS